MKKKRIINKKTQMKLIFILAVLIILCIFSLQSMNKKSNIISDTDTLIETLNNKEDLVEKEGQVLNIEPINVEVAKPAIPGYIEIKDSNYPLDVFNNDITIRNIGSYSGPFVEDGSNENVENILGVILHNNSSQMIEACLLTLQSKDGTVIQFMAASIPANSDILVLAQNRYVIQENDYFNYNNCVAAYVEDWHRYNDLVEVKYINQAFSLTNTSNEDLDKVYVCYKNKVNDIYFGGITYRVSFNNVLSNQTYTKKGTHFNMLSEVIYVNGN